MLNAPPVLSSGLAGLSYTANLKDKLKVLDFVKSGGPKLTVDRTIFELWLGL